MQFKLIYFKELINFAMLQFFIDYNDSFINQNNQYIFSKNITNAKLISYFKKTIKTELLNIIQPYDLFSPVYYLIIGGCFPSENILLQYKHLNYFPEKLNKLLNSNIQIKYLLNEKDIKIDIIKFNEIFMFIFNELFSDKQKLLKYLGKKYSNVFFIQHSRLDCYLLFKTIKFILGSKNCINLYKEKFKNNKQCIIAINDKIQYYIHNKSLLNSNLEYKNIVLELKQYLFEILNLTLQSK